MKSLKELYRIGHGPSSSHTMGPGRAAELYLAAHPEAEQFEVTLYGALAASGKGHFTDKILLDTLGEKRTTIHWSPETVLPRHPNAMKFDSTDASG